jgi:hypothetical protein
MDSNYHWGSDRGGLELGLRVRPSAPRVGEAIDVQLAARNRSSGAHAIAPNLTLALRTGDALDEYAGGPRSAEDLRVGPGEVLELVSWRLTQDQLGTRAGPRVLYAVYRPREGGELRSGEVSIEVSP